MTDYERRRLEEKAETMGVDADVLEIFRSDATRFDDIPIHSRLAHVEDPDK